METSYLDCKANQKQIPSETPVPSWSLSCKTNFCFRFIDNRFVREETRDLIKSSLLCKNIYILSLDGDSRFFVRGVKRKFSFDVKTSMDKYWGYFQLREANSFLKAKLWTFREQNSFSCLAEDVLLLSFIIQGAE